MGLDYSTHPVDPALFRDRLIPCAMGLGDISDLIDRAVKIAGVRHRAAAWGKATIDLSNVFRAEQEASAPAVTHSYQKPGRQTLLGMLLGRKPPVTMESYTAAATSPGIPAFDADLHVWGRPFFNTASETGAVLAIHRDFLESADHPPSHADEICRSMIDALDRRRSQMPPDLHAAVIAKINNAPPYLSVAKVDPEFPSFDAALARKTMEAQWFVIRALWDRHRAGAKFDLAGLEREARIAAGLPESQESDWVDISENAGDGTNFITPADALAGLPYRIMQFASELQPGWMGRGRAHTSSAFAEIGVDVSHLIETPASLFSELIAAAPAAGRSLDTSLSDNFMLGGYVPPEKVPQLMELLDKHQHQLVRAWVGGEPNHYALQDGMNACLKNLEPAAFSASKGWGVLEAAEIYSGFFGVTN